MKPVVKKRPVKKRPVKKAVVKPKLTVAELKRMMTEEDLFTRIQGVLLFVMQELENNPALAESPRFVQAMREFDTILPCIEQQERFLSGLRKAIRFLLSRLPPS